MMDKGSKSERNRVFIWAAAVMLLTSLPYIWGYFLAPKGYQFLGLTHNIDDGAVYLSWMRQAADGQFFIRNLFTNEPQSARAFNVLFLLMGSFGHITHLPLILVFHLFRVGLGFLLIWSIWRFSKLFLDDPNERGLLIPLVSLSAGVGWLIPNVLAPTGSVDMWQPEAITFLSLYLNPLFLAGLVLMIWSFYFLIRMQRSGRAGDAALAGIMLLLLGNIHTYDVITVACVWTAHFVISCITVHKFQAKSFALSLLAAIIALPSIAYQYHIYKIDPVYAARANSPAPSPEMWSFFAGYGLIFVGAIVGATMWVIERRRRSHGCSPLSTLHFPLLIVWGIVGFVLPYIPIGQQRKLVMGLHIPLCILCAYALCKLIARVPSSYRRSVFLILMLVMAMSNVKFVAQDMRLLSEGRTVTHYAPFISNSDLSAMQWLRRRTQVDDTIFSPPTFALFAPAFTGHQVYYGHWSETPDYASKLNDWFDFINPGATDEMRADILRETGAKYVAGYKVETRYLKRVGPDVYEVDNAL